MANDFETVSIVGLGYIGLPTAATIASRGVDVIGVDVNQDVVKSISEGKAHFSEPDLDIMLNSTVTVGKLRAVTEPEPADVFVIAVPTPMTNDKTADMSYVEAATRAISKVIKKGDLIILESTSPVGATEQMCQWLGEERSDLRMPVDDSAEHDVHVAYCPERILPGQMLFELINNDRIIGGVTSACAEKAKEFYGLFVRGELFVTKNRTAEAVKLLENAYRDVNIAFANEISVLFEEMNVDTWEAIQLANRHPRVNILTPGPGVGGHCIAIDPWFLIAASPEKTKLMSSARTINDTKPDHVLTKINRQIERFRDPVVACLGLAYKPDVDDLRESPALKIAETVADKGLSRVLIVEPNLETLPAALTEKKNVEFTTTETAISEADIIVLLVAHKQFKSIDRRDIYERIIIDTVGAWQLERRVS